MKQELEVLEKLSHPNIVRVLDLLEDSNSIYIVLELMHYGNLAEDIERLKSQKMSFTERDAATIIQ